MKAPITASSSSTPKNVVLLRVGIDSGAGGMQGPLLADDSFEFIPIPDGHNVDERTYGNIVGRHGRPFSAYFPPARRERMAQQAMHVDPEWETFTYGDPTRPKAGLSRLQPGDLLVFYCGLQRWDESTGWDQSGRPALYLAGYFTVALAGRAREMDEELVHQEFAANFHVRIARSSQRNAKRWCWSKATRRAAACINARTVSAPRATIAEKSRSRCCPRKRSWNSAALAA